MTGRRLLALLLLLLAGQARAQSLSADLSSHIIGITTGFAGADLVLFGATDQPGDVVVVVRGPPTDLTVRRKEQVLGLWLNRTSVTYHDIPSFYQVVSTKPVDQLLPPETRARYGIGIDNLRFRAGRTLGDEDMVNFRAALVASRERADLYRPVNAKVLFVSEHLFRADMEFPANVPTGYYTIEVDLVSGGDIISAQTTPLVVSRIGFSNGVFEVAHQHAALYGAGALFLALGAGWAAGAIFRNV